MEAYLTNPILPGFHPDPCVCRRGEDYYIALSTFEWLPGIPIYHSRDLKHWSLLTHGLQGPTAPHLEGLPSAKGVWAPCLTWCEQDGLFYLTYSVMHAMNARYFDVDNYVITAPEITGPWSEPVYLHSAGFDGSMFHDDDGKKYVVALEWETRPEKEKPGAICLVEYDARAGHVCGPLRRIYRGGTDRGCIEGPHLYQHGGWYYLLCAEGGTGYLHSVTVARAKSPWGPYEPDPQNPVLTSVPGAFHERADWDHLKPRYYNPEVLLQKAGHGSLVETSLGEVYLFHHCARPFTPELRCTLGRETAIQKMTWTEDGWLRLACGGCLPQTRVPASALPDWQGETLPELDEFTGPALRADYYSPRWEACRFAALRAGRLVLTGHESLCSLHHTALVARKLTSLNCVAQTRMDFSPATYHHAAGLVLYYDNMNYAFLSKTWDDELGQVLILRRLENGVRSDSPAVPVETAPLSLRLEIRGRSAVFSWSGDGLVYAPIGPVLDTSTFSDEYCTYGEFTGTMVGLACEDSLLHERKAAFDCFKLENRDPA